MAERTRDDMPGGLEPHAAPTIARLRQGRVAPEGLEGTLERGLRVLHCFSPERPRLGNGAIAELSGLPKPTVSRLTAKLIRLGYLRRAVDTAEFEVGPAALCLGYSVFTRTEYRRAATTHLRELAEAVDGTAAIQMPDGLRMVTLEAWTRRDVLHLREHHFPNVYAGVVH